MSHHKLNSVFIITGTTAIGKSHFVCDLGAKFPIEIINADSQQVYKYMSIGTAQPDSKELLSVKHHLVNFLDPSEKYSAGKFIRDTQELIHDILNRNKIPFIVGGSFFYIQSLWDGLLDEPFISEETIHLVDKMTPQELLHELELLDPISFNRIHPNNLHRVRRALLVTKSSNRPFSSFKRTNGIYNQYKFEAFELYRPKEEVNIRIEERVSKMFQMGWMQEIYNLLSKGYSLKDPGLNALGYKEILTWLEENKYKAEHLLNLNEQEKDLLTNLVIQKTKAFAKKQRTWFNNNYSRNTENSIETSRLKRIDYSQAYNHIGTILIREE